MNGGDEAVAKQQFLLLSFFRLTGLALMLGGLFIGLTDVLAPGGWPLLGAVMLVAGAADAIFVPWFLRRQWKAGRR